MELPHYVAATSLHVSQRFPSLQRASVMGNNIDTINLLAQICHPGNFSPVSGGTLTVRETNQCSWLALAHGRIVCTKQLGGMLLNDEEAGGSSYR